MTAPDRYLTIADVAAELGVSIWTAYRRAAEMETLKTGRVVRVTQSAAIHSPLATRVSRNVGETSGGPTNALGLKIPVSAVRFRLWAQGSKQITEWAGFPPVADVGSDEHQSADVDLISDPALEARALAFVEPWAVAS